MTHDRPFQSITKLVIDSRLRSGVNLSSPCPCRALSSVSRAIRLFLFSLFHMYQFGLFFSTPYLCSPPNFSFESFDFVPKLCEPFKLKSSLVGINAVIRDLAATPAEITA